MIIDANSFCPYQVRVLWPNYSARNVILSDLPKKVSAQRIRSIDSANYS